MLRLQGKIQWIYFINWCVMRKKRKILLGFIIVILAAVLAVSGYYIWRDLYSRAQEKKDFEHISQSVSDSSSPSGRNISALIAQNSDCLGWVSVPNTTVDYPVMHTPDNPQKYLRLSFKGKYSFSGVPFLDARCSAESDNLIIYGHNLKNDTMFSSLAGYAQVSYSKKHPEIEFETEAGNHIYSVFAVVQVDETDEWYNFIDAPNSSVFDEKISEISEKAIYTTKVVPEFGRQLLTLSTCYGSQKNDRLMVIAVKQ